MTDSQKKSIAVGGFVVLALGILYYQLRDDSPAPRPAQVAVSNTVQPATVKPRGMTPRAALTKHLLDGFSAD